MKKHLVIVCGILYPNPSPTGLCALRYASLLTDFYDIEFIALSSNGKEEDDVFDVFGVHTLSSRRMTLENSCKSFVKDLVHLVGSIQLKLSLMGNLGWFVNAAFKKLEGIQQKREIDAILTVCSPLQAHIAGARFKDAHPAIRFCAYTVDPFASSSRVVPFFRQFKDIVSLERDICSKADCLFLSEEAYLNRQDVYGVITNKRCLPYLLPSFETGDGTLFDKQHIHCVYAGSFYRDIRNPEFMMKVFSILSRRDIILHLYSSGCDDMVSHYSRVSSNIVSHGYVSQKELREVYSSCDFLIGVGNVVKDFLPSKTFEYISIRKPIVFFNPKGANNPVLAKYPHALQISEDEQVSQAAELFIAFVESHKGTVILEEELGRIYPNNTGTHIRGILLSGLNNERYGQMV